MAIFDPPVASRVLRGMERSLEPEGGALTATEPLGGLLKMGPWPRLVRFDAHRYRSGATSNCA